jgi:predicted lipoprotein with Yx(FWY)xxD motif
MSALDIGKVGLGAAGAAALMVLLSACGSGSSSATSAAGPRSGATQSKAPVTESASALKTMSTSIGTVLVGPSSRTVYELVGDSAANPTCTGGCLAIWPPVMKNGSQVIVNGHPAFTYVNDTSAGQANGQNVTDQWGRWLALDASGNPISGSGATTPSPSASASKTKAPNSGGAAF